MKLFQIIITIFLALVFSMILVAKFKAGLALSFVFLFLPVYWKISKQFDVKNFLLIFFIIYPLLPVNAGINLGEGIPVLRAHRIAVLLLLVFLISKGLLLKCYNDFIKSNIFTFNIVFIIISMIVTSFFSANQTGTLFFIFSLILEFFIFSAVVFYFFNTDQDIEQLIDSLLISCTILCIFGLFEKITSYNFYTIFGVYDNQYSGSLVHQVRDGAIRVLGPFDHSIAYAAYLILIMPLFLYKFRTHFAKFNISILLIMLAVLFSQSRAGMLGAAIIFFLYFLLIDKKNLILIIIISIPIVIYYAGDIGAYLANLNPSTSTSKDMSTSTAERGAQILFMVGEIKKNILFGYGMVVPNIRSVDNFYLLYTYQYGIVGIITYFLLMLAVMIKPFWILGFNFLKHELTLILLFSIFTFLVINSLVALWSYHFIYYVYIGIISRKIINKSREANLSFNES